ncbi:hypothetical protein VNO80_26958 [Phaseolus coccineus]|uniref:Uncharacterized protein n=1 Tax=Phaseolus coccineus TaxID=3886 RepID=A0AAN9LIZ7_PHACN
MRKLKQKDISFTPSLESYYEEVLEETNKEDESSLILSNGLSLRILFSHSTNGFLSSLSSNLTFHRLLYWNNSDFILNSYAMECIHLCGERGANIEAKDEDGAIPLQDVCWRILESVDSEGDTPLLHAARGEHADVIRLLLSNGASSTKEKLYRKAQSRGEL